MKGRLSREWFGVGKLIKVIFISSRYNFTVKTDRKSGQIIKENKQIYLERPRQLNYLSYFHLCLATNPITIFRPFSFRWRWNERYVWNNVGSIRSQVIYFWTDMNVKYPHFFPMRNPQPFVSTSTKMMKKISSPFTRCSNRDVDGKHI